MFACLYPGLCEIARARGYALAIHGSMVRDLDLIAVPWTDAAVPAHELVQAIKDHVNACQLHELLGSKEAIKMDGSPDPAVKAHGRLAWMLYVNEWTQVDLSVIPIKN